MSDDAQVIMDSLRRIVQALRRSSVRTEQISPMTGAQALVLRHVGAREGLSVNDLAGLTFTHQSTVSEVVGRLEAAGLLIRRRAADDGRRVELQLTDAGRAVQADLESTAQEGLMEALNRLPIVTLKALATGLEAWTVEAGLGVEPAVMFFEPDASDGAKK
ncbi:MAG: winged helix-turn-helix transcriptional regulator [Paracoccaceae bacterium]|nr:winged helix-turn-helix transcriptional regulator [Paracoccaceae bacterium]